MRSFGFCMRHSGEFFTLVVTSSHLRLVFFSGFVNPSDNWSCGLCNLTLPRLLGGKGLPAHNSLSQFFEKFNSKTFCELIGQLVLGVNR